MLVHAFYGIQLESSPLPLSTVRGLIVSISKFGKKELLLCTLFTSFGRRDKARNIAQDNFLHGRTEFQVDILKLKTKASEDLLTMLP